jgi:hypothetical protein
MKEIVKSFPLSIVPKALLGLAMLFSVSGSVRAQEQSAQVIEVTAKKYEYSASPIHVKSGTKDHRLRPRPWFQNRRCSRWRGNEWHCGSNFHLFPRLLAAQEG